MSESTISSRSGHELELTGISPDGSILEARDGSLMLIQGGGVLESDHDAPLRRISLDGGATWSDAEPLPVAMGAGGVIRLHSGALAMYGGKSKTPGDVFFSTSSDDGRTWAEPVRIPTYPNFRPMYHSLIQLRSGRLLLTGYWEGLNAVAPDAQRYTISGAGIWHNRWMWMEGHRGVEMGIGIAYYSDDEGGSWRQCEGGLFGWFDERGVPNGEGGILDVYEPTSAECPDSRVLMMLRSKAGRLLQSCSPDGGHTWFSVLPTELSSSQSPPMLVQVPGTGDLLCVWNQVSAEEIRRGFLRGRLSSAISLDGGLTWEHFRTIELQEGMEDVARIAPEFPIPRVTRARPGIGYLPEGFAMFTYPNVDIVGDQVFLRYLRMRPVEREGDWPIADPRDQPLRYADFEQRGADMTGESVLRRYPLPWFYTA